MKIFVVCPGKLLNDCYWDNLNSLVLKLLSGSQKVLVASTTAVIYNGGKPALTITLNIPILPPSSKALDSRLWCTSNSGWCKGLQYTYISFTNRLPKEKYYLRVK